MSKGDTAHPLRIVAAAILFKGITFTGVRHGHIIRDLVEVGFATEADKPLTDNNSTQGFIDINGFFRTRASALEFAVASGQVKKKDLLGTELTSEDLW